MINADQILPLSHLALQVIRLIGQYISNAFLRISMVIEDGNQGVQFCTNKI